MNILIASDKFKGSLTAKEVCSAIELGIRAFDASVETMLVPMADGGEGTLEVLEQPLNLTMKEITVQGPLFRPIQASYGFNGDTAYIEMARASGFELLTDEERSAMNTSSVGTGELIRDAINYGAKHIFLYPAFCSDINVFQLLNIVL